MSIKVLFLLIATTMVVAAIEPCVNVTSPLLMAIPNSISKPNGNSNGLYGNARITFNVTGDSISNINATYSLCSSNPLLAPTVVSMRFRSFINQTSYFDSSVPICDNVQGFCEQFTSTTDECVGGYMLVNTTWPIFTVAAMPQMWITGTNGLTYGRFKAGAETSFREGLPLPL